MEYRNTSEIKCAQKAVKMDLRAFLIMRTYFNAVVFSDLNYYHSSMLTC